VVEHCSLLQITRASTAFSPLGTAWIASGGMFMKSASRLEYEVLTHPFESTMQGSFVVTYHPQSISE